MSCTDKNSPQIPWNETGYRLDSLISSESYGDTSIKNKTVYYYSSSSRYCDSSYTYGTEYNQWVVSTKETFKYNSKWNITEHIRSLYINEQWVPSSKETCRYDSKQNITEDIFYSYGDNNKWHPNYAHYYVYDQNGNCSKSTYVSYSQEGEETLRSEYYDEFDSQGNKVSSITKSYLHGSFISYNATRYEYYYTESHVDSVYNYATQDEQSPFECTGKTIYLKNEDKDIESIHYNYRDNQFVPGSKNIYQSDEHGRTILSNSYNWKNNEWTPVWLLEYTYQYIPETDLLKEAIRVSTDFYNNGDIVHKNTKEMYYYTKL